MSNELGLLHNLSFSPSSLLADSKKDSVIALTGGILKIFLFCSFTQLVVEVVLVVTGELVLLSEVNTWDDSFGGWELEEEIVCCCSFVCGDELSLRALESTSLLDFFSELIESCSTLLFS